MKNFFCNTQDQSFRISCGCEPYSGDLKLIQDLESCVRTSYQDLIKAMIVHGSVATGEIINYSDFDGLLIIKDQYKNSAELKKFIKKSLRLIYQFDPLQHHGWFIIYEGQLQNYPQTYFPYELFEYSRVIFPRKPLAFDIIFPADVDYYKPFHQMSEALLKKIENNFYPKNVFQLKGFLSQILLLPALYVQAKEKKGVFKKHSFELVRKDFSIKEWEVVERATVMRQDWSYRPNKLQKVMMCRPEKIFRTATKKLIAPAVNARFHNYLDKQFFSSLDALIHSMNRKVQT